MIKKGLQILFFPLLAIYFIFFGVYTQHTGWIEMIVYPYLLNNGFLPYKELIAPYTPLMLYFLQLLTGVFGYKPEVMQVFALSLGWINAILIFFAVKKLYKSSLAAFLGSLFYALWFFYFEGNALWFELFQTPFLIVFFYHSFRYFFTKKTKIDLLIATLMLAICFFIKQSAIYFIFAFILWILIDSKLSLKKAIQPIAYLIGSLLLVFLITAFISWAGTYFTHYLRWAFKFTFLEFPLSSGHKIYPTPQQLLKLGVPLIMLLPLLMAVIRGDKKALFSLFFVVASFMAVFPRWGLFHLQPFLALVSLSSVPFFEKEIRRLNILGKFIAVGVIVIWLIVVSRQMIRFYSQPIRFFEPSVYQSAEKIKQAGYHTHYLDAVFIFNGPDQLYPILGITPIIKPYVQNFSWQMEVPGMQERVIASLQIRQPKYIIYSSIPDNSDSLEIGSYAPKKIIEYLSRQYILKEKISEDIWILERI